MTCSSPSTRTLIKAVIASAAVALAGLAQAQAVFKITAIPDESPTELARKAAPLVKYLEHKLGTKVEFTPVSDYAAAVEALANKQVDMAWYGGFTFVQASIRSGGKVVPLVQREEDEKFRSVFISADPAIRALAELGGDYLERHSVVFLADISGMPAPIASLFAVPAMRDYGYRVMLDRSGRVASRYPGEKAELLWLDLDNGELRGQRQFTDVGALRQAFQALGQ